LQQTTLVEKPKIAVFVRAVGSVAAGIKARGSIADDDTRKIDGGMPGGRETNTQLPKPTCSTDDDMWSTMERDAT